MIANLNKLDWNKIGTSAGTGFLLGAVPGFFMSKFTSPDRFSGTYFRQSFEYGLWIAYAAGLNEANLALVDQHLDGGQFGAYIGTNVAISTFAGFLEWLMLVYSSKNRFKFTKVVKQQLISRVGRGFISGLLTSGVSSLVHLSVEDEDTKYWVQRFATPVVSSMAVAGTMNSVLPDPNRNFPGVHVNVMPRNTMIVTSEGMTDPFEFKANYTTKQRVGISVLTYALIGIANTISEEGLGYN